MGKKSKFGDILRKLRKKSKVRSYEIANLLGVTRAYITTFERNKQPAPTYDKCEKIVELLNLTEEEKLMLYVAAFDSRASEDAKAFLSEIKRLLLKSSYQVHQRFLCDEKKKNVTLDVSIPLIEPPSHKVLPPYQKCHVIKYISLSEISSSHYYAIYPNQVSSDPFFNHEQDIVLIDPIYQILSPGDLVYVKIGDLVQIQRYDLLQTDRQVLMRFDPYCEDKNLLFDPVAQKGSFEILGKVVVSLRYGRN